MRLGIDIGGTTVKIGAVTSDGEVLARIDQPFIRDKPFPALLADLVEACRNLERYTDNNQRVSSVNQATRRSFSIAAWAWASQVRHCRMKQPLRMSHPECSTRLVRRYWWTARLWLWNVP